MPRNLLVFLRYDGRAFHGWQVQKNAVTAMGTFQTALEKILGEKTEVKGCSRTDAGVHAAEYGVSFRTSSAIPAAALVRALNAALPPTMAALSCREVPPDFHARYSCAGKRYCYRILNREARDPFAEGFVLRVPRRLDEGILRAEAADFVGTHDFAAFRNTGTTVEDTVRTIFSADVSRRGDLLEITVEGDGFLYNMVRIQVGTLLEIASGRLPRGSIPAILLSRDRSRAGFTAPACGLMLEKVFYDESVFFPKEE